MFWNSDILPSSVDFMKSFFDFTFVIFVLHRISLLQSDVFWASSSCLFCFYCCVQSIEQNKCTKVNLKEKKKFGKKTSVNVMINKVCAWSIHQLLIFRVTKKKEIREEKRRKEVWKKVDVFIIYPMFSSFVPCGIDFSFSLQSSASFLQCRFCQQKPTNNQDYV